MSFNYSTLTRNSMHTMVPLMGNVANGTNFLPQLAVAAAASASSLPSIPTGPSLIPSHLQATGLNDSPLEFKNTSTNNLVHNKNSNNEKNLKNCNNMISNQNQMGAGPMDLENENENSNSTDGAKQSQQQIQQRWEQKNNSNLMNEREISINNENSTHSIGGGGAGAGAGVGGINKPQQQALGIMGSEIFLNGVMGVGPPPPHSQHPHAASSFMMMPGMMMDPATMAATLQMQQFPLMTAAAAAAATMAAGNGQTNNTSSDNTQSHQQAVSLQQPQQAVQVKEVITCKSCTLYPPNPNAPPPTIRERPPGCRTVFVGGLPENITEEIIREVFESCGEITTLRLSKKNFCHIRFVFEASVDSAIYLSGYRIRIANSTESANCGRLHVDYAQARDDQYEWECKQRQLQREQRHRERMERDRLRSNSPPPIVHYTEHEASNLADKLKNDESFLKAVQTLITWLERGDCSKKNANTFYSMIQSTNAHVRRLQNDKMQYEEDLRKAREQYRKQMLNMTQQFTQIEKVFSAASHKKVWDHFTKAQRKNIDLWKKQSTDIRCVQIEDDEMEMSDDDRDYRSTISSSSKRARYDNDHLKEENDSLRCQLEAYKNEMNLVKSDIKSDSDIREQQIKVLQETIRNLQTQLLENKTKEKEYAQKVLNLEAKLKEANVKELLLKTKIVEANSKNSLKNTPASSDAEESAAGMTASSNVSCPDIKSSVEQSNEDSFTASSNQSLKCNLETVTQSSIQVKSEKMDIDEARIIGVVSTFLVVHPFGASPDYICSYLQKIHPNLHPRELEEILGKYKTIFCEEITGIGAKIERKWKFCGFDESHPVVN